MVVKEDNVVLLIFDTWLVWFCPLPSPPLCCQCDVSNPSSLPAQCHSAPPLVVAGDAIKTKPTWSRDQMNLLIVKSDEVVNEKWCW